MDHLFLIGYMGVGKSEIGRSLAANSGMPFIDMDTRIERECGRSIPTIFAEEGEDRFRKWEHELLKRMLEEADAIIATGGGTPCSEKNLELMERGGRLVHLRADPATILRRTRKEKEGRPKLKGLDENGIRRHMEERRSCYEAAEFTVNTDQEEKERIVERILAFYYSK